MASKRERVLIAILVITALGTGSGMLFSMYSDNSKILDEQVRTYTAQIVKIREKIGSAGTAADPREELADKIREAESRFYKSGETDLYKFGLEIQALFTSYGIRVESYRNATDQNTRYLEYTIKGNALVWMRFLKKLSEYRKAVHVYAVTVKGSGNGELSGIIRVGYEEIDISRN